MQKKQKAIIDYVEHRRANASVKELIVQHSQRLNDAFDNNLYPYVCSKEISPIETPLTYCIASISNPCAKQSTSRFGFYSDSDDYRDSTSSEDKSVEENPINTKKKVSGVRQRHKK